MEGTDELGIVADMQCGGWSTNLLTSKGAIYSVGVLDGLRGHHRRGMQHAKATPQKLIYPAGFLHPSETYDASTAVKQFSVGRSHVLAVSDSGRIWSWDNIEHPAYHVKLLDIETKEDAGRSEKGYVEKVVAGWNKSAALVVGGGLVLWEPLSRNAEESSWAEDTALVMETAIVPVTESQHGKVRNFILLENYVVLSTSLGKIFAGGITWTQETKAVSQLVEVTISHPFGEPQSDADTTFATDIQGSFRSFAIFLRSGAVLTGHQDNLNTLFAAPTSPLTLRRIPALQHTNVISIAFGDYHFHALHASGTITSYGNEPSHCGALGLRDNADPQGRLRGLRSDGGWNGGDAVLVPHAYSSGRQVWFEEEKLDWLSFLADGGVDPEEARERARMCAEISVQGEVSEWIEQEGRAWAEKYGGTGGSDAEKTNDDDELGAYFALSVTAAGWHSGALVLVNEDLAQRVREGCVDRPPADPKPFDPDNEAESARSSGLFDRAMDVVTDWMRRFLSVTEQPVEGAARNGQQAAATVPMNNARTTGAVSSEGLPYKWAKDSFPRLKLADGREMPGTVDFHEWRSGRPEWNLRG